MGDFAPGWSGHVEEPGAHCFGHQTQLAGYTPLQERWGFWSASRCGEFSGKKWFPHKPEAKAFKGIVLRHISNVTCGHPVAENPPETALVRWLGQR